jgi:hypothetical protein
VQSQTVRKSVFWPELSAHQHYWERNNCAAIYEYDRTADGPEVEIINAIKITHPLTWDPTINHAAMDISRGAADWLFTTLSAADIQERDQ